jgi:hypothetical protein
MVVLCLRLRAHSALGSFAKGYEDVTVVFTITLVLPSFDHHLVPDLFTTITLLLICLSNLLKRPSHYEKAEIAQSV